MSFYVKNLYEKIIRRNSNYNSLKVMTGYASSTFLEKVIEEFPKIKIEMYIGMSRQGISKQNHTAFCDIMKNYDNVYIYYQIKDRNNHMKILQFTSINQTKVYIGSANFTENGFINNQEIMVESYIKQDDIFNNQNKISLLCNNPSIDSFIDIYEDDTFEEETFEKNQSISFGNDNQISSYQKSSTYISTFKKLKNNSNFSYFTNLEIEVVLGKEENPTWSIKGINSWKENKKPIIQSPLRKKFENFFPANKKFDVYTDDGMLFKCQLGGKFNTELQFIDINIYEYVKNRINLEEKRPISKNDLIKYGNTKFYFTRVEENMYLLDFSNHRETL